MQWQQSALLDGRVRDALGAHRLRLDVVSVNIGECGPASQRRQSGRGARPEARWLIIPGGVCLQRRGSGSGSWLRPLESLPLPPALAREHEAVRAAQIGAHHHATAALAASGERGMGIHRPRGQGCVSDTQGVGSSDGRAAGTTGGRSMYTELSGTAGSARLSGTNSRGVVGGLLTKNTSAVGIGGGAWRPGWWRGA